MAKKEVEFRNLGNMPYKLAWDYQEQLLQQNVAIKSAARARQQLAGAGEEAAPDELPAPGTVHYLLFVEHPPVYTLGTSGDMANVLLNEENLQKRGIDF